MNRFKKIIRHLIYKIKYKKMNTNLSTYNFGENVKIGKNCTISKKVYLENNISIGDCTYISSNSNIYSNVSIGKFCSIAPNVNIAPGEHNMYNVSTHPIMYNSMWRKKLNIEENDAYEKMIGGYDKVTKIGNDVWIALNVFIKRGIIIGDGAVIGAGSVVTKNVEPYSIVAGNPAKIIKYRTSKENIDFLEKHKWWNQSYEKINKYLPYMYNINEYIKKKRKE